MKILLILILCLIEGYAEGSFNLTGYAGGSILIKCNSTRDKSTPKSKSFCKEAKNDCDELFKSNASGKWHGNGQISLYENITKGFFKVAMRNLTVSDTGKYWCEVNGRKINGSEVHLNVVEGKRESRNELGYVGQDILIKCPYEIKYKKELKYLCKNEGDAFKDKIRTGMQDKWINSTHKDQKRFSLYDNTTAGVFMVSITNLTEKDAGIYWCGVHVSFQKNSSLSVDNITEVILNVKNGHLPLIPLALVLSLAVGVLVLGMALFFCRRRGKKITKDLASDSNPETHNNRELGHVYDEIQEPPRSLHTGAAGTKAADAVYANAQLPTILLDDTTYSTVQLPTIPSDDTTYSTVQLPTIPSDDTTYSTVQLPTNLTGDSAYYTVASPTILSDDTTYSIVQLPKMHPGDST